MRVSSVQFIKNYGSLSDRALTEPITITRNGRDRLVLVSAEEFERLRRYSRQALAIEELSEADIEEIAQAKVPPEYDHLNTLLED